MRIAVVGTGYVGLVSGACLAELGHDVVCLDVHAHKIALLRAGVIPIYEPGLEEIVKRNVANGRLKFTTNYAEAIPGCEVAMIAVGTPSAADGSVDMQYVESAARMIGEHLTGYAVVVDKSTVPVGTSERVAAIISGVTSQPFDVVSVPEFLREGQAVKDFLMKPSRVVIGSASDRATRIVLQMFDSLDCPKVVMDPKSAELTKYASNAFLATKIGFINEVAHLCEELGADVDQVAIGMGLDPRIGKDFLRAGLGWGGSCFPKDVKALHLLGKSMSHEMPIVSASLEMNRRARSRVIDRLAKELGDLTGKKIGILGIAFKADTDDTRDSASIELIRILKERGADMRAYDPIARMDAAQHGFEVPHAESSLQAAEGAHALVIATDWPEFRDLDLAQLKITMANPLIMDARNMLDSKKVKEHGFRYIRVGRQIQ